MKNLLIVEDNLISGTLISAKVHSALGYRTLWAKTFAEAIKLLDENQNNFLAALLDYVLPDAPHGEIIDEVVARKIPAIVFTATVTREVRETLWRKRIVDYVIKDDAQSLEYLIFLLARIEKNREIKAMIVDDSRVFRARLTKLLQVQNFQVFEAENGREALRLFKKNQDIKLILTDYLMPIMDGCMLIKRLRRRYGRDAAVILGMTSSQDKMIGAQFIKSGANDFFDKRNFITEELYCRINQNIENLESLQLIQRLATIDHLSGLYNRRHFYELASKIYSSATRSDINIACAILDIDYFKQVNDNYGHNVGDQALQHLSGILAHHFQRSADLIGRTGGEEFCILANNLQPADARALFEKLREAIEASRLYLLDGREIRMTASIGICTKKGNNLDYMLNKADELLYQAKNKGRNRIIMDNETEEKLERIPAAIEQQ